MSNVLSKDKQNQVIALGKLGWSLRQIQQATGVRRETASSYLRKAGVLVRQPRHRQLLPPPESKPASQTITDPEASPSPEQAPKPANFSPRASSCEPYRTSIEESLERGRNAMAIWQDLVDTHGFPHRYSAVLRFVRKLQQQHNDRIAHPVITTPPGEEAQVDYGDGPMVLHPTSGKYRRTRLFILTLGYSRKAVRLLTWRSSSEIWCQLHEKAFRRLGGVPKVVVLDNLKEGVIKADVYDPVINPLYHDMLKHYGATALPCRVRHPDRKGKVESSIGHTQRTPLKGMRFETIEQAQEYLDQWDAKWADTRIHGTTKRQVAAMFAEEKPNLQALPSEAFHHYQHGVRKVHLDGCIEVSGAYYSVPHGFIGQSVYVQWDGLYVRILNHQSHALLRQHIRQERGKYRIETADRSAKTPKTTLHLLEKARVRGRNVGLVCQSIHRQSGERGVRQIMGVLSLAKKFDPQRLDDACLAAIECGLPSYRFVKRYLERQRPPIQLTLKQVDPLIRQLTQYRDLVLQQTKSTGDIE